MYNIYCNLLNIPQLKSTSCLSHVFWNELVGIFILYQLSRKYNKNNIGLCRTDDVAVFKNISGSQAEKTKKHFYNMFRKNNFTIIVKCNL